MPADYSAPSLKRTTSSNPDSSHSRIVLGGPVADAAAEALPNLSFWFERPVFHLR
jgi:hypothetical protein